MNQSNFLHPLHPYHGHYSLENLAFNANTQAFSQKVNYICNLQTNGKLSAEEAYDKVDFLWQQLQQATRQQDII
ncbi:MAG: hypothetical protein AAGF26_04530 [Cyanobacteria bacterium P01_G01_bin.49]